MFPIRIRACSESDLRMLGNLARNIQRVLPVTQADIDAAAALGKGWVVWKVIEVNDPLDNLRGGTQLVIKQNSVQPGQNVRRVLIVSGPSGEKVIVGPGIAPLSLPDAIANSLDYVKAYGGTKQTNIPDIYTQVNYVTNTAQTEVDTGVVVDRSKSYVFEYRGRAVTGSWYILQARYPSSGVVMGLSGSNSNGNFILSWAGGTTNTTSILRTSLTVDHIFYVRGEIDVVNGTLTLYVKDETSNTEETVTGICSAGQGLYPTNVGLLGNLTEATTPQMVQINNDVYMARITENGVTIMDYVPARQGTTAGFYDKVSGTFKTAETPENLSADGDTVPTPDAPMNIVCNNGTLKARHQSGLPLGYTQVEYLESFGGQYIDTGRVPNNTDIIEQKFQVKQLSNATTAWYGSMPSESVITPRIGMGTYLLNGVTKFFVGVNATNDVFPNPADTDPHTVWWHAVDSHTLEFSTDGSEPRAVSYPTGDFFAPSIELTSYLFARHGTDGVQVYDGYGTKIYYHKEYLANGTLVLDLVPVRRNSDNELGMYDFVSGQFFTNQGSGAFSAGNPVSDPVEIYADGLVETIEDTIGNTATCENLLSVSDYTDVQEILSGDVTRKVGIKVFDGTEDIAYNYGVYGIIGIPYNHNAIVVGTNFYKGFCSHAETYTNSVPVAARTFDKFLFFTNIDFVGFGSYEAPAEITDVASVKQWLADQYAAGTPVIIVYPLATETTESVAGQTLNVTSGDNVIDITQASLSDLELEAEYTKVS